MKTRLVRIGNSRGVRIPKPLIEQAGLTEEVEMGLRDGAIVIQPAATLRSGWADAAKRMRQLDDDLLLDPSTPTNFDEGEWEW